MGVKYKRGGGWNSKGPRIFDESIFKAPDECWYWTGAKNRKGYGMFRINGKAYRAHRISYETRFGLIPTGLSICHRCDNPLCVNPDHLFTGTQLDNMRDRGMKGRQAKGNKIALTKLDQTSAIVIREAVSSGYRTKDVAIYFNVSAANVSGIVARRFWKYV